MKATEEKNNAVTLSPQKSGQDASPTAVRTEISRGETFFGSVWMSFRVNCHQLVTGARQMLLGGGQSWKSAKSLERGSIGGHFCIARFQEWQLELPRKRESNWECRRCSKHRRI